MSSLFALYVNGIVEGWIQNKVILLLPIEKPDFNFEKLKMRKGFLMVKLLSIPARLGTLFSWCFIIFNWANEDCSFWAKGKIATKATDI